MRCNHGKIAVCWPWRRERIEGKWSWRNFVCAPVLASWRPGVLYNLHPRQSALTDGWKPPDQERPNRSQCNNIELRLDRTPGHQDTRTRAGRKFNPPHLGRRGRLPYVRRPKRRRGHENEIPPTPHPPTFPTLLGRPASRQRKGAVSRREPRAIGSRRVFCGPAGLSRPHFTSQTLLRPAKARSLTSPRGNPAGGTAKKLGASPSARPLRRPAAVLLLFG